MRISPILIFLSTLAILDAAPLRVGVSVLPLEPVVRELGGEWVEVRSLQQEGDSCSVFEPRPSSISWLAQADLFFRTGVGYETVIMEKIRTRFPGLKVIDLREAVETLVQEAHSHHHHGGDEHICGACGTGVASADPHLWTDPQRLSEIGELISSELIKVLPDKAAELEEKLKAFQAKCGTIDQNLSALLEPYAGRSFYIYHPALAYFADRYQLHQIAISGTGQSPTARELHQRLAEARKEQVQVIFVQPQESRKHAEIIAGAIGAQIVEIDPMATDWDANLMRIGNAFKASFEDR
jgi:zinc transport system substrate-binding protein